MPRATLALILRTVEEYEKLTREQKRASLSYTWLDHRLSPDELMAELKDTDGAAVTALLKSFERWARINQTQRRA